mgnify:CR=1 FL=1
MDVDALPTPAQLTAVANTVRAIAGPWPPRYAIHIEVAGADVFYTLQRGAVEIWLEAMGRGEIALLGNYLRHRLSANFPEPYGVSYDDQQATIIIPPGTSNHYHYATAISDAIVEYGRGERAPVHEPLVAGPGLPIDLPEGDW